MFRDKYFKTVPDLTDRLNIFQRIEINCNIIFMIDEIFDINRRKKKRNVKRLIGIIVYIITVFNFAQNNVVRR